MVPGALNNQISSNQRNPPVLSSSSSQSPESIPSVTVPSAAELAAQIEAMKPPIVDLRYQEHVFICLSLVTI